MRKDFAELFATEGTRAAEVLPMLRELFSQRPEARCLEPWELQSLLFSLGYANGLLNEGDIAAALGVARTDYDPDEGVA
jgi:hypothetical protein